MEENRITCNPPGSEESDGLRSVPVLHYTAAVHWFHVLVCFLGFRAFVDANVMKKRRQQVFDQLGGFSQQGAVCSILGKGL